MSSWWATGSITPSATATSIPSASWTKPPRACDGLLSILQLRKQRAVQNAPRDLFESEVFFRVAVVQIAAGQDSDLNRQMAGGLIHLITGIREIEMDLNAGLAGGDAHGAVASFHGRRARAECVVIRLDALRQLRAQFFERRRQALMDVVFALAPILLLGNAHLQPLEAHCYQCPTACRS